MGLTSTGLGKLLYECFPAPGTEEAAIDAGVPDQSSRPMGKFK